MGVGWDGIMSQEAQTVPYCDNIASVLQAYEHLEDPGSINPIELTLVDNIAKTWKDSYLRKPVYHPLDPDTDPILIWWQVLPAAVVLHRILLWIVFVGQMLPIPIKPLYLASVQDCLRRELEMRRSVYACKKRVMNQLAAITTKQLSNKGLSVSAMRKVYGVITVEKIASMRDSYFDADARLEVTNLLCAMNQEIKNVQTLYVGIADRSTLIGLARQLAWDCAQGWNRNFPQPQLSPSAYSVALGPVLTSASASLSASSDPSEISLADEQPPADEIEIQRKGSKTLIIDD